MHAAWQCQRTGIELNAFDGVHCRGMAEVKIASSEEVVACLVLGL